jgi:hypothetical protein
MQGFNRRLDAFWVSKLGVERLAQLPGGDTGKSAFQKALAVTGRLGNDRGSFHALVWEGFDGYFHQSVYARRLGDGVSLTGPLSELSIGEPQGDVSWWSVQKPSRARTRVLGSVRKRMEFLDDAGSTLKRTVAVPVLVEGAPSLLRLRILTVQSTASTWSDLLGVEVRRILTPVVSNELVDRLLHALDHLAPGLGEMQDLSARAIKLMEDTERVFTYSGTLAVKSVGRTRHTAEGGRHGQRRQPLHAIMKSEFQELVTAERIRHCEIEVQSECEGLPAGAAVVLYPVEGRISLRRMLGGGVIDGFLNYLAC